MLSRPSQGTLHYKELTLFIKGWIWGLPLSTSSIAMFSNKKKKQGLGGWINWGGIKWKWERERQTLRTRASVLRTPCDATFKSNWPKVHAQQLMLCKLMANCLFLVCCESLWSFADTMSQQTTRITKEGWPVTLLENKSLEKHFICLSPHTDLSIPWMHSLHTEQSESRHTMLICE